MPASSSSKPSKLVRSCFCSILLLLGSYVAITTISDISEVFEARSWPTAQGVITSYEDKACGKNGYKYPSVSYEFTVNGIKFSGSRITLSPTCSIVGRGLLRNEEVVIHYSPENPSISVIYTNDQYFWHWFNFIGGIAITFTGIIGVLNIPKPMVLHSDREKSEIERIKTANTYMEAEIRDRQSESRL